MSATSNMPTRSTTPAGAPILNAPVVNAPVPNAPVEAHHGSFVSDTMVIARRALIRVVRTPQLVIFSSIQPIMFILLFRFVFGGSIQPPGYRGRYADYLVPGILVQLTLFGGQGTAFGLAEDMSKGIVDRFRSLPMSRSAVLAGRTLADLIRSFFVILLLLGVGTLVGFRFHNGFFPAVAAIVVAGLFGFAFSWFFAFVGLKAKDTETVQVAGFLPIFPLVFAASTFTPIDTMPGWLQAFAKANPVTNAVNAIRALSQGRSPLHRFTKELAQAKAGGFSAGPFGADPNRAIRNLQHASDSGRYLLYTLLWCVVIIGVFGNLAVRAYRQSR